MSNSEGFSSPVLQDYEISALAIETIYDAIGIPKDLPICASKDKFNVATTGLEKLNSYEVLNAFLLPNNTPLPLEGAMSVISFGGIPMLLNLQIKDKPSRVIDLFRWCPFADEYFRVLNYMKKEIIHAFPALFSNGVEIVEIDPVCVKVEPAAT